MSLPVPVTRKRFFAPLWVLFFGILSPAFFFSLTLVDQETYGRTYPAPFVIRRRSYSTELSLSLGAPSTSTSASTAGAAGAFAGFAAGLRRAGASTMVML